MQKQTLKKILLTCLFTSLVLAFLPTQISWAGLPAQSVPTAGPSPTATGQNPLATAAEPQATAGEPQATAAKTQDPAAATKTPTPAGTLLVSSPTPRVFPTSTKMEPNQNTPTAAQAAIAAPETQSTPTPEVVRPIAASLTAVVSSANQEKTAGANTLQLYLMGLLLVFALLGIFLFLRRGKR